MTNLPLQMRWEQWFSYSTSTTNLKRSASTSYSIRNLRNQHRCVNPADQPTSSPTIPLTDIKQMQNDDPEINRPIHYRNAERQPTREERHQESRATLKLLSHWKRIVEKMECWRRKWEWGERSTSTYPWRLKNWKLHIVSVDTKNIWEQYRWWQRCPGMQAEVKPCISDVLLPSSEDIDE